MEYNINFCIISIIYLSITAFFYRRQARVPSTRSALFDAMLWCGILSIALDIVAAVVDLHALVYPAWSIYTINIIFLITVQMSGVLLFFYAINLTGVYHRMNRRMFVLVALPYLAVIVVIVLSAVTHYGAFYLDAEHIYHHGRLHFMLYITMAFYLLSSFFLVLIRRKRLQGLKFYTILSFLLVTFVAMLIQMRHPYLLVNSTANAFALTLIYHILEAPSNHVDALTGVLNRSALQPILQDIYDTGSRCSLVTFSLDSLSMINTSFGMQGGDAALITFADYLRKKYPKQHVLRVEGDVFGVVLVGNGYMDFKQVAEIYRSTIKDWEFRGTEIAVETSVTCINSEDCDSAGDILELFESIMRQREYNEQGRILLVDKDFQKGLSKHEDIERATLQALDEERTEVYFQPIHNAEGKLCALEALVRIQDPVLGFLPPQELVEISEQNGSILRLGEQVLRRTCEFIRDNHVAEWGLDHVGVNLSALQCVSHELPQEITHILAEYGVEPGLVAFEVTETAVGTLSTVRENMEKLLAAGVYFLLDDFGTGYANFKNMAALPYRCIKIDKSLLWSAQGSEDMMHLLSGVVKVIHTLGLASLCEGVETESQVELLRALDVKMLQGYYYSKPLAPEHLLEYVRKEDMCR